MTERRRVAVTGLGAVTPLGLDVHTYWEGLISGASGIGPITLFDASTFSTRIAGEVKGFNAGDFFDVREAKRLDRFAQFAMVASLEAAKDSGIDFAKEDARRCGAVIGSGIGGLGEIEDQHTRLMERGAGKLSPFMVPKLMMNAASGQVSIYFGLRGPTFAVASACASATNAIGEAARLIGRGDADVVITGGAEATVTPLGVGGFCALKALSTRNDDPQRASRPFDADRDGFVLGEGSGIVVLEEYGHARARGARVYAELAGYASTSDAYHITAPQPEGQGAADAMRLAVESAGLEPGDITYINAHGTSTDLNDVMETRAIKTVFGEHARKVVISSTKSAVGHLLGASGAVELIASILAIKDSIVPPTINLTKPDPECDLDYVPNVARKMQVDIALSNSFGFGGHNACLVVRRAE
jgi:3-oxoacyl-[acyl-carrier-protein] synthase II